MKRSAFTLVELLVVISIIGLLSTIAIVSLNSARAKSRDTKRMADLKQISTAIELFSDANGYLPRNTAGWCTTISDVTNGWGAAFQGDLSPYLSKVPLDPLYKNTSTDYLYSNVDNKNKYTLCANLENSSSGSFGMCGRFTDNYCISPNGT